jgi:hypothetical protein
VDWNSLWARWTAARHRFFQQGPREQQAQFLLERLVSLCPEVLMRHSP